MDSNLTPINLDVWSKKKVATNNNNNKPRSNLESSVKHKTTRKR